jgi:hypothetical protein
LLPTRAPAASATAPNRCASTSNRCIGGGMGAAALFELVE